MPTTTIASDLEYEITDLVPNPLWTDLDELQSYSELPARRVGHAIEATPISNCIYSG